MDRWIDELSRKLAAATSRRTTLKILGGILAAGVAATLTRGDAEAAACPPGTKPCRYHGTTRCINQAVCCNDGSDCQGGRCIAGNNVVVPVGGTCTCSGDTPTRCPIPGRTGSYTCTNLQTAIGNCGTCGTFCRGASTCLNGVCTPCGQLGQPCCHDQPCADPLVCVGTVDVDSQCINPT
jgi:hypothetical protein